MHRSVARTSGAAFIAAIVLIIALAVTGWPFHFFGAHAAGSVDFIAIDTDNTGNTASAFGPVDSCNTVPVGGTRVIDVGFPSPGIGANGISGFQFDLIFD